MNRFRIEFISINSRGDGNILVRKPNRKLEKVQVSKVDVALLLKYFEVEDWKKLNNKVFTFDGEVNILKRELHTRKFLDELQEKSQQN